MVVSFCASVVLSPAAQAPEGSSTIRLGQLQRNGQYRVEAIALEDYVARVLAGEAARNSPPAALEALGITIRTYALANAGRHRADGFDMCDQTHCQVPRPATAATHAAAAATAGRILTFEGRPAEVFYSASCGGRTEAPSSVWPGAADPPYLPVRNDEACKGEPAWTTEIDGDDLLRALRAAGYRGSRLAGLLVVGHDESGRVSELVASGLQPSRLTGQGLREIVSATLGPQYIRSTAFAIRRISGGYEFSGTGSGHGVGLCVIGSVGRAEAGESAAAILARYFPGTTIALTGSGRPAPPARPSVSPVSPPSAPGIPVALPDDDGAARDRVARMATSARAELAAALAVAVPADVSIRVHPTNASFERATGQSWYVLSAVVAGEVHLVPLEWLETRGILERTLRRAMTHVLIDPSLERRPAWVREGLAAHFADPGGNPPSRGACPADADLQRSVSPGALSLALQQAHACVAAQLAAGRDWREIR